MKRNEVLALDAEFVLDMCECETIAERLEDEADAKEWNDCCRAIERAEANYFENRNPEARYEMEWQDAMGWT